MITYTKHVSQHLPDDGSVYVFERYLDDFTVVSRHEIPESIALIAVGKYLEETKVRPKYRNFKEELLDRIHGFAWSEIDEPKYKIKINQYLSFPSLLSASGSY